MAARAGIGFTPLDNGFAAVDDVAAVQQICDSFDETVIWDLAAKWMAILPCPFTAEDTASGHRYEVSVLQAEFSLTQVLDAPVTGRIGCVNQSISSATARRIFFEQVIRDNLDIGRPEQVGLIFARRIIRKGPRANPAGSAPASSPTVSCRPCTSTTSIRRSSNTTRRAKRSERKPRSTTPATSASADGSITCPRCGQPGFTATRRLLDVQKLGHDPADGQASIRQICDPLTTGTGTRVAGMRLGDPRVHALLAALCVFRLLPRGFANRDLRPILAQLPGVPAESITPGKMTYDLRRLRQHGLIERIPHTFRYQVTRAGLAHALFLTQAARPVPAHRPGRPGRSSHQRPRPISRHTRLHQRYRRPHPASRPRRLTTARRHPTIPTCKHRT